MTNEQFTKNDTPLLTIAVPTYNGSRTIRNMLDVLLPQVTPEVEVLISDNCSTDETPKIIEEYYKKYPFIHILRNATNIGPDGNFLQCMLKAAGKFVMLISDDDIIVEGAVPSILGFLKKYPDVSLVYLESLGFKDVYRGINSCHRYRYIPVLQEDVCTVDKKEFLTHCVRMFGFTSSFVWSTERIRKIDNPKKLFGTYFLQAYISVLCSDRADDQLGIIHSPCIAVGEYGLIGNFDTALVEGIYYHKMLELAVTSGYDRKIFEDWYIKKLCILCRRAIILERASKNFKTKVSNILKASWRYPLAWISLYPFLLLPNWACRLILKTVRTLQKRTTTSCVNRPTD